MRVQAGDTAAKPKTVRIRSSKPVALASPATMGNENVNLIAGLVSARLRSLV